MRQITLRCESYLLTQPPSIKSLVLSDLYAMRILRRVCIQYAKDTPISELKKQPEFGMIHPPSLNEILLNKVEKFEPQMEQCRSLMQDIRIRLDQEQPSTAPCTGTIGNHLIGAAKACFECKAYNLESENNKSKVQFLVRPPCKGTTLGHTIGETNDCSVCKEHNLETIRRMTQVPKPVPYLQNAGFTFGIRPAQRVFYPGNV